MHTQTIHRSNSHSEVRSIKRYINGKSLQSNVNFSRINESSDVLHNFNKLLTLIYKQITRRSNSYNEVRSTKQYI